MLQLKQWLPVLLFVLIFSNPLKAVDYTGENLLSVVGMNPNAKEFKPIKEFWLLDKNLENEYGGIKFSINPVSGKIESICNCRRRVSVKWKEVFEVLLSSSL